MIGFILFVIAGILLANGVPHFVKGISGKKHITPFKNPSSAAANVLWGAANLFGGFWLAVYANSFEPGLIWASVAVFVGAVLAGVRLATWWQNDARARGE